jgi:hypothetical protein
MPNEVAYKEDALVITISTNDPGALHELLLRGLADAFRNFAANGNQKKFNAHMALIDLLDVLLPDETALSKVYA